MIRVVQCPINALFLGVRLINGFGAVDVRPISTVVSLQVEENSWVLHQTTLRVSGPTELSLDALFAPFSFRPGSSVSGPLVFADPPTAHDALVKNSDVRGR